MLRVKKQYNLFDIYWDQSDIDSVSQVISRGAYWAVGPEIKMFENDLKDFFGVKYALAFCNGTAALHSLLLAHGITSGEVIIPSFSFIATANAVVLAGATPVFAEIEEETLGLDPLDVEKRITPNTKAILPMHYGGKVCKYIKELKEISDKHNIPLIEDNAESFGAKLNDKFAGTFGNSAILSFCQNKILPTGEGGAIITNSKKVYEKLILIRSHGRVEQPNLDYFHDIHMEDYIEVGYNYRMPTICAALGRSQFKKLDTIIKKRRLIGKNYDNMLSSISGLQVLHEFTGSEDVYQLYSVFLKDSNKRNELQEYLLQKGIFSKIYFAPIHLKSFYRNKYGYKENDLPITEMISKKIITLPFSLNFSIEDQNYIVKSIKTFFEQ